MKHSHNDPERLTFGCNECAERVKGDQFWADFNERTDTDDLDDYECAFGEAWDDDRVSLYMRFIPPWMLRFMLTEYKPGDEGIESLLSEAARRLKDGVCPVYGDFHGCRYDADHHPSRSHRCDCGAVLKDRAILIRKAAS